MTWRPARSLTVFHEQLKNAFPRARPPATPVDAWGLIGDAAHDPTSDHSPHDFPGWGTQIVTAADFPNRPDLGLDAHQVLDNIRLSRDPRVKYAISNRHMFSSYPMNGYAAWTWRPYSNADKDPHEDHGHLSVVGDARSDGTSAWVIVAPVRSTVVEDEMGASFGPVRLVPGANSLCIPPASSGIADPRDTWLRICNDTFGKPYKLRIFVSTGDGNASAIVNDGMVSFGSLEVKSWRLAKGVTVVSIIRYDDYDGDLSVCFERE